MFAYDRAMTQHQPYGKDSYTELRDALEGREVRRSEGQWLVHVAGIHDAEDTTWVQLDFEGPTPASAVLRVGRFWSIETAIRALDYFNPGAPFQPHVLVA
jgi:hypothetical protein